MTDELTAPRPGQSDLAYPQVGQSADQGRIAVPDPRMHARTLNLELSHRPASKRVRKEPVSAIECGRVAPCGYRNQMNGGSGGDPSKLGLIRPRDFASGFR